MTKIRTATTALLSLASPVWCFTAEKADLAAAAACSATDGEACVEEADAHALLSLRASHVKQRRASTSISWCPDNGPNAPGPSCVGNQCCPGGSGSLGLTFPCPGADPGWNECETKHEETGTMVAEEGTEGDGVVVPRAGEELLSLGAKRGATCPGSKWMSVPEKACSGNQCCDGIPATHGKTFPCPDAEDSYHDCAIDWAMCHDGETRCVGNQCCPRHATPKTPSADGGGENMTYPCPGADPEWNGCENGEGYNQFGLVAVDFNAYQGYDGLLNITGVADITHAQRPGMVGIAWILGSFMFPGAVLDARCTKGAADDIANGCGIHIHEGKTCEAAGGHYWQKTAEQETDPWLTVKYVTFADQPNVASNDNEVMVNIGYDLSSVIGRTMVVHDYTGARVSCSIITANT